MKKIDSRKELKHLYRASAKQVAIVDVPEMNFLMIDGAGNPNTSEDYQQAISTLYPVACTLKFMIKHSASAVEYGVLPLETPWWADDPSAFAEGRKDEWQWTVMIMQPAFITAEQVGEAIAQVRAKKNPPALPLLRFEPYREGSAAQTLHIGPFSEEGPTIEKVHAFIDEKGYGIAGKHHEIYLSDVRRAAPEKWKTIIRQPFA